MDQLLQRHAEDYASAHGLQLAHRLGFGIHGIVSVTKNKREGGSTAIKVHRFDEPYRRERDIYRRLQLARISRLLGFHVPQILAWDDELLVIEMTIVPRPFILDFAGAYLDFPPDFPEAVWDEWEAEKQEQFGANWLTVKSVLAAFEELDIHLVDISPSNIAF